MKLTVDTINILRLRKKHKPFLRNTSGLLVAAMFLQTIPMVSMAARADTRSTPSDARVAVPSGTKPSFARTAHAGDFTIKAVKEAGEFGGRLTPATEDESMFTRAGNEVFGRCMQKWNSHRYAEAVADMKTFMQKFPDDPWVGEAEMHIACNHKYRDEFRDAEDCLVGAHGRNKTNPIGRKALMRLGHLYYETFRYQQAMEAFTLLLESNPIENEKTYSISWLKHIDRAWRLSLENRECGPTSFSYAAWLVDHAEDVRSHRSAEQERYSRLGKNADYRLLLPSIPGNELSTLYPWSLSRSGPAGMSLSDMKKLLAKTGHRLTVARFTFDELKATVSETNPVVVCLPKPLPSKLEVSAERRERSNAIRQSMDVRGNGETPLSGHYVTVVKANPTTFWVLDAQNGYVQWEAMRLRELWLQGADQGLVAMIGNKSNGSRAVGRSVSLEEQDAFRGGCCGTPPKKDDPCPTDKPKGMPEYSVNIYDLDYFLHDIPIWVDIPRGPDLELQLKYVNQFSNNGRYPIDDVQFHPFGYRWSGPYDARYYIEPGDTILVHFPNDLEVYFYGQSNGVYTADSKYQDHLDLSIASNDYVRVEINKGAAVYWFCATNAPAMQQTLFRVEDRFGQGVDVTRDGGGRITKLQSDVTGSSLNYTYTANGNVDTVYEKDGSGGITGREAGFMYEINGDNACLTGLVDMGGYTTTVAYAEQTYVPAGTPYGGTSDYLDLVTTSNHVHTMTWPNGGEWTFEIISAYSNTIYSSPTALLVTDPEEHVQTYRNLASTARGPFGQEDRNGVRLLKAFGTAGGSLYSYATMGNTVSTGASTGDYLSVRELDANGRDLIFERTMYDDKYGQIEFSPSAAISSTDYEERLDVSYLYTPTNDHRIITISNATYQVGGSAPPTDTWIEIVEQDENMDAIRFVDRASNTTYLDRTNRLVHVVRILPDGGSEKTVFEATYNEYGQMTSYTTDEGLQNTVSNVYDSIGLLRKTIYPDETSVGYDYDPSTYFMTEYTNRFEQVSSVFPDDMGRPLTIDLPDGTDLVLNYGCCAEDSVKDRYGNTSSYGYDGNKRLDWAVVPMDDETDTHYELGYLGEGELESLSYGPSTDQLATRSFGYVHENGRTQFESRNTPEGKNPQTWNYYYSGLPKTMTDGRGVETTYEWVHGKKQLTQKEVDGSDAGLETVTVDYAYDAQDRLTNIVKNVSGLGDIWEESYGYDDRSRIKTITTSVDNIPNQTSSLEYTVTYDYGERGYATNRTVAVTGSSSVNTEYTYHPNYPLPIQVEDNFATVGYGYDEYGRLATQTNSINGYASSKTVKAWSYNGYSKLDSLTVSNSAALLWGSTYGYDVERIMTMTNMVDNSQWAFDYDYQGQLRNADHFNSSGAIDHAERYKYDSVGNITHRGIAGKWADLQLGSNADDETVQFNSHKTATVVGNVDNTNAVVSLPLNSGITVEQEDGNWIASMVPILPPANGLTRIQLKAEVPGQTPDYAAAKFTVHPVSTNLQYDANGSLLYHAAGSSISEDLELSWNADGRLASAREVDTPTNLEQYFYDAHDRRIAKNVNGTLTLYLWDRMDNLGVGNSAGAITEYYTRGIGIAGHVGTLVAARDISSSSSKLLHSNHRGDVVLATSTTGAEVHRCEYTPFGNEFSRTGSYVPRFGFSSKDQDATGLVYYGYRYYSPELNQWLNPDPIGEYGGLNLYEFCENNPITLVDKYGLSADSPCPSKEKFWDCYSNCIRNYPYIRAAAVLTPLGLLNLKAPWEVRQGASRFTSLDRRLGFPVKGRGATVIRGTAQRVKYLGRFGTLAAIGTAFGIGYLAGAVGSCIVQCAGK